MKNHRTYIIFLIIITLISTFFPGFVKEDITKDSYVDLKDAVTHVRNLAETADQSGTMTEQFARTLSTLKIVAGIKTLIMKTKNDDNTLAGQSGLFILNSKLQRVPLKYISKIENINIAYDSLIIRSPSPPPKNPMSKIFS